MKDYGECQIIIDKHNPINDINESIDYQITPHDSALTSLNFL